MSLSKPKRKRAATACTQCYAKKQKCNHEFPCNHCTRRRQPELCSYSIAEDGPPATRGEEAVNASNGQYCEVTNGDDPLAEVMDGQVQQRQRQRQPWRRRVSSADLDTSAAMAAHRPSTREQKDSGDPTMADCLGYFEYGRSSLLGIMKDFQLAKPGDVQASAGNVRLRMAMPKFQKYFQSFPKRFVIDLLIRNFFSEANWVHEMIHPASFLTRYQNWWNSHPASSLEALEFAILLLRLVAYSAQFLPSETHAADHVQRIPVISVQNHCNQLATKMWRAYEPLGTSRTLWSVYLLFFQVCYLKNEGCVKEAWHVFGSTVRLAQDLGLHVEPCASMHSKWNELEKDMRRRAFWNLFILDRFFSHVLERPPCIADDCCTVELPKMCLGTKLGVDTLTMPHSFSERLLSIRLTKFWTSLDLCKANKLTYDAVVAQESYERLQNEFVATLPAVFRFNNPDTQWDSESAVLPRQRCMLRITVFVLICHLLRPILQLGNAQLNVLPYYKRVLIPIQRKYLVHAALNVLSGISDLHQLMDKGYKTKFFYFSFYTFESAMILGLHLLSKIERPKSPYEIKKNQNNDLLLDSDTLTELVSKVASEPSSLQKCTEAVKKAHQHLAASSDKSSIAKIGAGKLAEVMGRITDLDRSSTHRNSQAEDPGSRGCMLSETGDGGCGWLGLDLPQEPAPVRQPPQAFCTPSSLASGPDPSNTDLEVFDSATFQPTWALENQSVKASSGSERLFEDNNDYLTNEQNGIHDSLINGTSSVSVEDRLKQQQSWMPDIAPRSTFFEHSEDFSDSTNPSHFENFAITNLSVAS